MYSSPSLPFVLLAALSTLSTTLSAPNPFPNPTPAPYRLFDSSRISKPSLPTLNRRATTCNGFSSLCDRSYGNVTYVGAHDSYAVGSSIADNQDKGVEQQLTDGIRLLQVQAHNATDGIHLCHSSCSLLDAGTLSTYLTTVKSWMDANPTEVVTLLIVNSDSLAPTAFESEFTTANITTSLVYTPPSTTTAYADWPTLGTLIDAGTRLVVFMDYEADYTSVPWIIDEFSNVWEDAYDVTTQDFACAVNRTSGSPTSTLYLTNHFLDEYGSILGFTTWYPNTALLNETNAETGYGSIGTGVDNCVALYGRPPNFILLDFYDSEGNSPFNVAATVNGVTDPTNTVTPGAASSTSTAVSAEATVSGATSSAGRREANHVCFFAAVIGMAVFGAWS